MSSALSSANQRLSLSPPATNWIPSFQAFLPSLPPPSSSSSSVPLPRLATAKSVSTVLPPPLSFVGPAALFLRDICPLTLLESTFLRVGCHKWRLKPVGPQESWFFFSWVFPMKVFKSLLLNRLVCVKYCQFHWRLRQEPIKDGNKVKKLSSSAHF